MEQRKNEYNIYITNFKEVRSDDNIVVSDTENLYLFVDLGFGDDTRSIQQFLEDNKHYSKMKLEQL